MLLATPELFEVTLSFAATAIVTSFTPTTSQVTIVQSVVITGTDLDQVTNISWDDVELLFAIDSPTQITVTDISKLHTGQHQFLITSPATGSFLTTDILAISVETFAATPELRSLTLLYAAGTGVTSFTPNSSDIDISQVVSFVGTLLDTVSSVSLNGSSLTINSQTSTTMDVTVTGLSDIGTFTFDIVSPTRTFSTTDLYTLFSGKYGTPPNIDKQGRYGKFFSVLGNIKFPLR